MTEDSVIIDVTPEPEDEPDDAAKVAPEEKPKKHNGWAWLSLILILIVAATAGGVFLQPHLPAWLQVAPQPAPVGTAAPTTDPALVERIASLETQLNALESQLDDLANRPVSEATETDLGPVTGRIEQTESDLAALSERITRLSERLEALETRPVASSAGASGSEVRSLANQLQSLYDQVLVQQERLATLERAGAQDVFQPVTILAVSRLRQAVDSSLPYEAALDGVKRLFEARGSISRSGQSAVDTLEAHSATGVPDMTVLKASFRETVPDIMAARALPEEADWLDRTWVSIQNAVTIRQTGEIEGDTTDAIVARAEQDMERGDLKATVGELSSLTGRPAIAAEDWLTSARARLEALDAVDTLEAALAEGGA